METSSHPSQQLVEKIQSILKDVIKATDRLKETNSANKVLEDWHEDMLHHFVAEVGLNIQRIFGLLENKMLNLPTLAYVARNLLELSIWIDYSCKSKAGARQFYEDSYKDGLDLHKTIQNLIHMFPRTSSTSEIEGALSSLENTLKQAAAEAGVSSLDDDYKRVAKAAAELGLGNEFVAVNKLLSKFAHPTAMVVFTFIRGDELDGLFWFFFTVGLLLAVGSCIVIRKYVEGLGITVL